MANKKSQKESVSKLVKVLTPTARFGDVSKAEHRREGFALHQPGYHHPVVRGPKRLATEERQTFECGPTKKSK